jgi:hypothetical protein
MSEPLAPPERCGAYGFRVVGLNDFARLLVDADREWPTLAVDWVEDDSFGLGDDTGVTASTVRFTPTGATIEVGQSGVIDIERSPAHVTVRARSVAGGSAVVHPYLGGAASIAARWHGRESLHAGAFVAGDAAWGVLGVRTSGKSSLLASLHLSGRPIITDDVLVLDGRTALAAPRSLDLRAETADYLRIGEPLGRVGARDRWRVELPPVPSLTPIGGWVYLEWGDRLEVVPVQGRERLARLRAHLTLPDFPVAAQLFFELAALPSFELRRPRDWGSLELGGRALLDAIG